MCGIVGYVGNQNAVPILLEGLRRLEYRGYDSAGLALVDDGVVRVRRSAGRVADLVSLLDEAPISSTTGVAHTRWATHGPATEENAHPHTDASGKIAVVHNGIIENHASLRAALESAGISFVSETDTEVLAKLIGNIYAESGDMAESLRAALQQVQGTYGLALVHADEPGVIYAARCGSPLIVGTSADATVVASDTAALAGHVSHVTYLEDGEIVRLQAGTSSASTIRSAVSVRKDWSEIDVTLDAIELGRFEHHMLKEIYEQPTAIRDCLRGRVRLDQQDVTLGGLLQVERTLPNCRRSVILGCGSAWHAGLVGEFLLEDLAGLPTEVHYASEYRYRNPIVEEGTLGIAISQSGETADTLAALHEIRTRGATTLGVVNTVGSTIARETDAGVYLHVGPEIGVASTKAFSAQLTVLTVMSLFIGRRRNLGPESIARLIEELAAIPDLVETAITTDAQTKAIAERLIEWPNWLYLGRGVNYPIALEGALKLKEVSYLHAEGLPAAEMKHGPIALIEAGMPVVVIAPKDHTYDKVLSNIEEVRSRHGRVIAVASEPDAQLEKLAEEVIYVPRTDRLLSPLVTVVPLQLLAYHAAVARGLDVDKPRNLAKSVTVE